MSPQHPARTRDRFGRVILWLLTIAVMGAILYLSSLPGDEAPGSGRLRLDGQKLGHVAAYALLAVLVSSASGRSGTHRRGWWALVLCVGYGVVLEVYQDTVPGRDPSLLDVGLDAAGALIGLALLGTWTRLRSGQGVPGIPLRRRRQDPEAGA